MKLERLKEYKDKQIAILGYGKEGKSSIGFLLSMGFSNITILDKDQNIEKQEGLNYILGDNYIDNLENFDLIFKTPGFSPYNPKIIPYKDKLTSQVEIFFNNYKGKVIGITGTKGKSTTSTIAYKTLKEIGYNTKLVGNIGNPVLDEIDILNNELHDFIVYEMSSYMLEGLEFSPYIGVINNIYDCHLDWHEGKKNYTNAKKGIIKNANYKLINHELKEEINSVNNIYYFGEDGSYYYKDDYFFKDSEKILKDENIILEGIHNRKNICVTIGILDIIDSKNLEKNIIHLKNVLSKFGGLNHRMENIGTYKGIIFIDDAIATTPESTIAAIKTYEYNIGTIFLGGQDSGFNFEQLKNILQKYNILNIVLFPDTGEKIFGDLSNYKYESIFNLELEGYKPKILKTKSMKNAVDFAYKNTPAGKICILSNAAPSFSLWKSYIEKGTLFQNEVKNYI